MSPERIHQLERVYMHIATDVASMSLATRSKVGAILVKSGNIVSMGWNGMPSGFPNEDLESINDDGSKVTNPLVLHAEANCILKCAKGQGISTDGATLFVTMSPCLECCKLIIQAQISRVVYRDLYRDDRSIEVLRKAGISVDHLPV